VNLQGLSGESYDGVTEKEKAEVEALAMDACRLFETVSFNKYK
jgi:hypothetical protein